MTSMTDEADLFAELARTLGHEFADANLLRDALTHRSFANEKPKLAPRDNERLEFLGDAALGLVVSELLFERYPSASEGELTRRRADLVCESSLADIARKIGMANVLRLGKGEETTGGRDKPRLLASALEACLGAIYVDAGPSAATAVARRLFEDRMDRETPGARDFKSKVQELLQSRGSETPRYELVRTEGPDHARTFHVKIVSAGQTLGEGTGRSKLEAEQHAAQNAFEQLATKRADSERAQPTERQE